MTLISNYNYINTLSLLMQLLISPTLVLGEPQVPCLFIFGDSMADNGNNNNLQTAAKVNYLPYGIDFPGGPTGRFTNGRNFADFIGELLGFDKSIPPFSNATNEDILKGVNYASGGGGILDESGAYFGDVVSLNKQLSNHETTISTLVKLLASKKAAKQHLKSCLYYMGMGNNDYLTNYLPKHYSSTTQYTPTQFAAHLITKYSNQLQKLYDYGARKVAVFGAGKLGCIPSQVAAYGASNGSLCVVTSNDIIKIFNDNLQPLVDRLNNRLPNANFLYAKDNSNDASYGNIKIMSEPCCATSAERKGFCVEGGLACSNRDEYYYWDEYHPTEAVISISANIAYNYLTPLLAYNYLTPLLAHPNISFYK